MMGVEAEKKVFFPIKNLSPNLVLRLFSTVEKLTYVQNWPKLFAAQPISLQPSSPVDINSDRSFSLQFTNLHCIDKII